MNWILLLLFLTWGTLAPICGIHALDGGRLIVAFWGAYVLILLSNIAGYEEGRKEK
jgi:hypothetical protein